MARTVQETNLQSPTARSRLAPRGEPYYRSLQQGLALGYRRGLSGGTWIARVRDPLKGSYTEFRIGPSDDLGQKTAAALSFDEAAQQARHIYEHEQDKRAAGVGRDARRKRVNDALDLYVADYKDGGGHRGGKPGRDLKNLESILRVHVRPRLGDVFLSDLNAGVLEKFKLDLVLAPKLNRNGLPARCSEKRLGADDPSCQKEDDWEDEAERIRKRRARANRIITPLRAALNNAVSGKLLASDIAWREALKPYPGVEAPSIRFLSLNQAAALQQCADADFRPLVTAALFTGGRYGSLRNLRVRDLNLTDRVAEFRVTKSGKRQRVSLTNSACQFFEEQIEGRGNEEFVFLKASGTPWRASDQTRRMLAACERADIDSFSFHELRDTFASHLAMRGVPILTLSKLLGHADTRITEKYYAHLDAEHLQAAVDSHLPDFNSGLPLEN